MRLQWLAILCLAVVHNRASAQVERYDVGRKLIAFEQAWDDQPDAAARKRTVTPLKDAMSAFFSARMEDAGKELDEARRSLASAQAPPAERRWADSLAIRPTRRLVNRGVTSLDLRIARLYAAGVEQPTKAAIRVSTPAAPGWSAVLPLKMLPFDEPLPLPILVDGDHTFAFEDTIDGRVLRKDSITISIVDNLNSRLARLASTARNGTLAAPTLEQLTLRNYVQVLIALGRGATFETDYPAARLLSDAEAIASAANGEQYFQYRRAGQFWVTVPSAGGATPARIDIPANLDPAKPVPLVVALHGAGGTENLFFEAYGHGEIVRQCRQRGWLLVAPRSAGFFSAPPVADIVNELAKRYPVDRRRVFVVGHSMGAGHAVSLAQSAPDTFAGVAPLAGGGRIDVTEAVKNVPFFVGCGTEDFLIGATRALAKSLAEGGVKRLKVREYPNIEHITIVQVALPDVFRWFDELAAR